MDNLISNAIKFSGDGNRIELSLKQVNRECIIEVKDFGLGIPEGMLPYVFDRFSKAGRKGVRGEDSIGMGLNIARQIINKHGGDISVESTENEGTTFTIVLPQ
jgi:signal transduction histidine kinase